MRILLYIGCFLFAGVSQSQCYFSTTGDSVMIVDSYWRSWDTTQYTYFYQYRVLVHDAKYGTRELEKGKSSYSGPGKDRHRVGFRIPDSLLGTFTEKAKYFDVEELDSVVQMDANIWALKRVKLEEGGCSKGCSWRSYYRASSKCQLSFFGKSIWEKEVKNLYFVDSDYIAWGKRPKKRSASYFQESPGISWPIEVYWSERFQTYLVNVYYSTRRFRERDRSNQYNKESFMISLK